MAKKEKASKSTLRIQKKYLVGLSSWLNRLALSGAQSRYRTRFMRDIADVLKEFEAERKEIVEKYVVKEVKDNGKEVWKQTVDNGQPVWEIQKDKEQLFADEVNELLAEDFVLVINEENQAKIACIKDILLNTDYKFGPEQDEKNPMVVMQRIKEANDYDVWCEVFEGLKV